MLFEALFIISLMPNIWFLERERRRKKKSHAVSGAINELIKSIRTDDGWVYVPQERSVCAQYKNKNSGIRFSVSPNVEGYGKYGGIFEPISMSFSSYESERLHEALEEFKYKKVVDARLKGLENVI
jgi:hypothetical protein